VTPLIAFHGDPAIKAKYLARVAEHRRLDNLVRGATGHNGKGCAVWCTLNKYQHLAYESELGIPRAIAWLEDGLFESLPLAIAMKWPERFLSAIPVGADLSLVLPRFFVWMLIDPEDGALKFAGTERAKESILAVAELYQRKVNCGDVTLGEFKDAAAYAAAYADAYADAAAYVAAYAAYADAAYAAYAAAAADADADAAAAAYAAAAYADAADAADAAYAAAYAAAAAYADADHLRSAFAGAREQCRIKQADKLIEILASAPILEAA
jgi:hypothetical protein